MSGHKVSRVHDEFIKRVCFGCVERLGQRPELDFKLPAGGSVPVLFSSLVSISDQSSWRWRQQTSKSAMFLASLVCQKIVWSTFSSNIIAQWKIVWSTFSSNIIAQWSDVSNDNKHGIIMAAKFERGYEERFESAVSKIYLCVICFNVFKDPVMCHDNEHLFCRACITTHIKNSQTCPSCMDELTVETLREAPRFVKDCLSEFKIRCEFFTRGCGFIELGKLEKHVEECGYAPVICSNEGCELEVNKRDLIHHETAVCEHRRVKCHNCEEMRKDLDKVNAKFDELNETLKQINANLTAQNGKLDRLGATVRLLQRDHNNRAKYEDKTECYGCTEDLFDDHGDDDNEHTRFENVQTRFTSLGKGKKQRKKVKNFSVFD